MSETCLWAIDGLRHPSNGRRSADPNRFRCTRDGKVFCQPCWNRFFGVVAEVSR